MKNHFFVISLGVLMTVFFAVSCQRSNSSNNMKAVDLQMYSANDAAGAPPQAPPPPSEEKANNASMKLETIDRKIIKTGDIRFRTSDLSKTHQAIAQAVQSLKGYVSEENQSGYNATSEMRLTVRIPAQGFDSLMHIITTHAIYFDSKNIHSQDVTEEFIDVSARLKTKKELENQYTTLLKKAQSIKEIMEVERELNNVRTEIESAEGRLRYLSSQVAFSTLNITFYKESGHKVGRGFWSRLGDSLVEGWYSLLDFVIGLASLWTFFLIFGVIFWAIRRILIARRAKK